MKRQRKAYAEAQSVLRGGDFTAALGLCDEALTEFPDDANFRCLAAKASLALRRFDDCREQLDIALGQHPGFATAHEVLGDLSLVEGNFREALSAYQKARKLNPSQQNIGRKIAKCEQLIGEAVAMPQIRLSPDGRVIRPKMPFADQIRQAEEFEQDGKLKEAEEIYRSILKKNPDHVEASRLLAGIAAGYEQYREAKVFLQRALELAPDYPRAWVDLANVQRELEEYDEAIESAARLIELAPDKAESHMVFASIVGAAGRHEEAIASYEKVLSLNPDKAPALCTMAHHLKTIGRQDESIARYRECIALQPDHSESYWSLANLKTFRFEDAEVNAMLRLLETEELGDESRAQIHNALGLQYEARKDFDRAFEHFSKCNLVRRAAEFYDPVDTEDTHGRVIELFSEAFFKQDGGPPVEPAPIFVVGLPRSGSTLIEQILASHSQVDGTHELSDLSKVIRAMRRGKRKDRRFPEVVAGLGAKGWSKIGAQYLERTVKHRGSAPYFIDKNPNNFIFIGLLKLAMPNAKIINARRHPLDSCLGSFKQLFASGQPFSYDMFELANYYLQYQRLMDHWQRVIPDFVLDVHYENVVGDLETQVRRLLEFCGLPFEESCLRFHETVRAVKTASSEQVRKPIYSTSVNLWRHYEHHLGEPIAILEPLLKNLPGSEQPLGFVKGKIRS
ncbi:sulfotransferase [Pseudomonadota bacterium]